MAGFIRVTKDFELESQALTPGLSSKHRQALFLIPATFLVKTSSATPLTPEFLPLYLTLFILYSLVINAKDYVVGS